MSYKGYCKYCGGSDYGSHGKASLFIVKPWKTLIGRIPLIGKVTSGHRSGCPAGKAGEPIHDSGFYTVAADVSIEGCDDVYSAADELHGKITDFEIQSPNIEYVRFTFKTRCNAKSMYSKLVKFQQKYEWVIMVYAPGRSLNCDIKEFKAGQQHDAYGSRES